MHNYSTILRDIHEALRPHIGKGKVADYIPALAKVPADKFGIAIETVRGEEYQVGDAEEQFSIQSISKVFTLAMAFATVGDDLWKRVGMEPSGNPFNSLVQLEYEKGIPRNPLINPGAMVVADILLDHHAIPKTGILQYVRELAGTADIHYDKEVARSERDTGFTNAALANFMKSFHNIKNPVEEVLDVYFHQCSIAMSCRQLSRAFLLFANHGIIPATGERVLTESQAKRLNAIMLTCGFYDEAGEFAFCVGLPGKSGVGGGIVAVIPGELAITVWSPGLNDHGNSVVGIRALELFTTITGMSIF